MHNLFCPCDKGITFDTVFCTVLPYSWASNYIAAQIETVKEVA